MSKQRVSLINVLNPPVNPWLNEITKRNANLPSWVHVVRFSDEDCDDLSNQPLSAEAGLAPVSTGRRA